MKQFGKMASVVFVVLYFASCNNFFHDLVPPDGDRITSFAAPGQIEAVIGDTSINVTVASGTDLQSLTPSITVSPQATLIPVTIPYIMQAFPSADLFSAAMGFYTSKDLTGYVIDLIKKNPDFIVPQLNIPIDFTEPVTFLVVSGRGNIRQYTVKFDFDFARILSFGFAKYNNPDLTKNAPGLIDETAKTITVNVSYPVENIASYELIGAFEAKGAVSIGGAELQSESTSIIFDKPLSFTDHTQTKTLRVTRTGFDPVDYTLSVHFSEDPDTVRSITDFRFNRTINPGISYTVMAEIADSGDTGTIHAQVYYSGTPPSSLIPSFTSPGNISVEDAAQTSGVTPQDFSVPLYYKVVSRTGGYTRIYRVTVSLVNEADAKPQIDSFVFTKALNGELLSNSNASIDHEAGLILVEAIYSGDSASPVMIPEFIAGGTVSVSGVIQASGINSQDFSRRVKYTVQDTGVPTLKRDYWIELRLTGDSASAAEISEFRLLKADNPGLVEDSAAAINQASGKITIAALFDSPAAGRTLIPRWIASGTVQVAGITQTSGVSGRIFGAPVIYRVISPNGARTKDYTVTVMEVSPRIYVDKRAAGNNNGSSWADAYKNLRDACEAAENLPVDLAKEIWIAEGTYSPSDTRNAAEYFKVSPNTSYIGGFAGTETSKAARNSSSHPVILTGELGGGVYSQHLFMNTALGDGRVSFEDLKLTKVRALSGTGTMLSGPALNVVQGDSSENSISLKRVHTEDTQSAGSGGAVYIHTGGPIRITDSSFKCSSVNGGGTGFGGTSASGGALYAYSENDKLIIQKTDQYTVFDDTKIEESYIGFGGALYTNKAEISGIKITNSRITAGSSVGGGGIYCSGTLVLTDAEFEDTQAVTTYDYGAYARGGAICAWSAAEISGIKITNSGVTATASASGGGIYCNNGTLVLTDAVFEDTYATASDSYNATAYGGAIHTNKAEINRIKITSSRVTADYSASGGGIYCYFNGTLTLTNAEFEDTQAISNSIISGNGGYASGGAIYTDGRTSNISGIKITNSGVTATDSASGGGIYCSNGTLTLRNGEFEDTHAISSGYSASGGAIYSYSAADISGITITDSGAAATVSASGGGIYCAYETLTLSDAEFEDTHATASGSGGEASGGAIYIWPTAEISRITITDSGVTSATNACGGGIYCRGILTLTNGDFKNTQATASVVSAYGGAIYAYSAADISGTNITDSGATAAVSAFGGGIYAYSDLTISDAVIKNTFAEGNGTGYGGFGGAVFVSGSAVITRTAITDSHAENLGGGISAYRNFKISDSRLTNCRAREGGAIRLQNQSEQIIENTVFTNCTSAENGKALFLQYSNAVIRGCTFINDSTLYQYPNYNSTAAHIRVDLGDSLFVIENCTFTDLLTNADPTRNTFAIWSRVPLQVRNCTFNFKSNVKVGAILAEKGLVLDGDMHFNDFNTSQPMLYLKSGFTYSPTTLPAGWLNNCTRTGGGALIELY